MTIPLRSLLAALAVCVTWAWGQPARRDPHIGYLFPAGGRRGTVVQIFAGGQFIKDVFGVHISGEGVRASVLRFVPPLKFGDKKVVEELKRRLRPFPDAPWPMRRELSSVTASPGSSLPGGSLESSRLAPLQAVVGPIMRISSGPISGVVPPGEDKSVTEDTMEAALLAFPMLRSLSNLDPAELRYVATEVRKQNRRQRNAQLSETAILEVTIDPTAEVKDRELRLQTPAGLTNPLVFQVGPSPELLEREPNNPDGPTVQKIDLPACVNGQIMPGDIDSFRIRTTRGRTLVIEAKARHLIPYLADAVPGWFQATLALYDSKDREVAFADDCGIDPDPILCYEVPEDGDYRLEVRDALYRGRQDFVYRVTVTDSPSASRAAPMDPTSASAKGKSTVTSSVDWSMALARFDDLPRSVEVEPNDAPSGAQWVSLPMCLSGTINQPGDVDGFRFRAKAGERVVAEVIARRQGSPLDSVLRLSDGSDRVLAWNDDHRDIDAGLLTHHADSYLSVPIPADGVYCVRVADAQGHGGAAHTYTLRISHPRSDFLVFVTPSSVNLTPGPAVVLGLHAVRRDSFNEDIEISVKDPSDGFSLHGNRIPRGQKSVRMTLSAPSGKLDRPVVLRLEARATMDGRTVSHPVIPADEVTQAFMLRHLMPAQELLVAGKGNRHLGSSVQSRQTGPVRIPVDGIGLASFQVPRRPIVRELQFELNEPPKGLSLQSVDVSLQGLSLALKADGKVLPVGYSDNALVEIFRERPSVKKDGKPARQKGRVSLGFLPAIPFEVVPK